MVIRTAAQNLFIIQKYAFYEYTGKPVQATAIEANGTGGTFDNRKGNRDIKIICKYQN